MTRILPWLGWLVAGLALAMFAHERWRHDLTRWGAGFQ